MSLLNGSAVKAREVIDFCMTSESPELKAKVFEIIIRSGLEPDDPMFMALLLTGQMRVLIEAAPEELGQLLNEWKQESAESLSEINSAISLVKDTQQEQALAIKMHMEAVSQQCVSDIKDAGMATTSAIADANSETLEQVLKNKKQSEELSLTLTTLQAEAKADREKNIENMNALIGWVNKTTEQFKLTQQQIQSCQKDLRLLQSKTLWLKWADWFAPIWALTIVGGTSFLVGGWLTFQKYNGTLERFGRNITDWNIDRIVNCQKTNNPKCTFWIVPPGSPLRNE